MDELEHTRMAGSLVDFLESLGYDNDDILEVAERMPRHLKVRNAQRERTIHTLPAEEPRLN